MRLFFIITVIFNLLLFFLALFTPKKGVNLSDLPSETKKEQIQLVNGEQWDRMLKQLDDAPQQGEVGATATTAAPPLPSPPVTPSPVASTATPAPVTNNTTPTTPATAPSPPITPPAPATAALPPAPPPVPTHPPATPAATVPVVCYQWGSFDSDDDKTARKILAKLRIKYRVTRRETHDIGGYWVYIPNVTDLTNKDWEGKLAAENMAFSKTSIKGKNAISLGYFKNEAAAKQLLNKAHQLGFNTTVISARDRITSQLTYRLVHVTPEKSKDLFAENQKLPTRPDIKSVECY